MGVSHPNKEDCVEGKRKRDCCRTLRFEFTMYGLCVEIWKSWILRRHGNYWKFTCRRGLWLSEEDEKSLHWSHTCTELEERGRGLLWASLNLSKEWSIMIGSMIGRIEKLLDIASTCYLLRFRCLWENARSDKDWETLVELERRRVDISRSTGLVLFLQ